MVGPPAVFRSFGRAGFTLVEMSVVLVIIGLIIGGVLVGRDLISAAAVRAQISQIEKYQAAVNTFRGKYGYLPGDIPDPTAQSFGFVARGGAQGQGDGNGVIEGYDTRGNYADNAQGQGETTTLWVDLSTAGLIEGGFNTANPTSSPSGGMVVTATSSPYKIANFLPQAKIGGGNYVAVWSGGALLWFSGGAVVNSDEKNYFAIFSGMSIDTQNNGGEMFFTESTYMANSPGVSVQQAYNIDSKIDDGLPESGNVLALLPYGFFALWVEPDINHNSGCCQGPPTSHLAASSSTCFDNNNVAGATRKYSMGQNNGAGLNCGLSFRFQ